MKKQKNVILKLYNFYIQNPHNLYIIIIAHISVQ